MLFDLKHEGTTKYRFDNQIEYLRFLLLSSWHDFFFFSRSFVLFFATVAGAAVNLIRRVFATCTVGLATVGLAATAAIATAAIATAAIATDARVLVARIRALAARVFATAASASTFRCRHLLL